jgi:hypothetical protein
MNTTLMSPVRGIGRRPPRRTPAIFYFAPAQLTATEQLIDCSKQPENDPEYTITESCSTSSDMVPAWLSEVGEQLQAIAALPNDWDSYGAAAPDFNKLEAAWGLLFCLCANTDLPKPYVNPTRNGGVQFEWEAGERYFEIEVVAERAATYLYCDHAAKVEETDSIFGEEDPLEPVRAFIRKVESIQ